MAAINRVVLVGNLTKDPELRHTQSGMAVCSLRLAVNTRRKDDTGQWVDKPNYFDITVWGNQGERCAQYLSKGRPVAVDGRLEWREWETPEGAKRQAVDIVADRGVHRYWLGWTPLEPTRRHVAEDVVVDLQDTRQLVERLRARREADEVVDAVLLLRDRVGEPAPAPRVVALDAAAALLDQRAHPAHDLALLLFGQFGIEQQQNLVFGHSVPSLLPSV